MRPARAWLVVPLALAGALAYAVCSHSGFLHRLAMRESAMDPAVVNPSGYLGLFQMGEMALQDAGYYQADGTNANDWRGTWTGRDGIRSQADFLADPEAQVRAIVRFHNRMVEHIEHYGLDAAIGQTLGGVPITLSGLVAGAHLVGIGSLRRFITSGGAVVPRDGNGVPITSYIGALGGCSLGSTSPGYAAVRHAAPLPGALPVPGPRPSLPAQPAPRPFAGDGEEAFHAAAGAPQQEVRHLLASLLALLMLLWLAWTATAGFSAWRRRRQCLVSLQSDLLRGCVLLAIVATLLW